MSYNELFKQRQCPINFLLIRYAFLKHSLFQSPGLNVKKNEYMAGKVVWFGQLVEYHFIGSRKMVREKSVIVKGLQCRIAALGFY